VKKKLNLLIKILIHRVYFYFYRLTGRKKNERQISIIVLNYNRRHLLERTLNSLVATAPNSMELWVIDNASTDDSVRWLKEWAETRSFVNLQLNQTNQGGEAFNKILRKCNGRYILISENDLEYLPGWFEKLSKPFEVFSGLGIISPLTPFPDIDSGEFWTSKPHRENEKAGVKIYEAQANIGTSAFFTRRLLNKGLYYKTLFAGQLRFPDDGDFSQQVKSHGLLVAWSDSSCVINWGHRQAEWENNPEYYEKNWKSKSELSIDGLHVLDKNDLNLKEGIRVHQQQAFKTRERLNLKKEDLLRGESRLFLDLGNGFTPKVVIVQDWEARENRVVIEFSLENRGKLKKLRWDPVEGEYISFQDIQIAFKGSGEKIYKLNPSEISSDLKTTDPQVKFNVPSGIWETVKIEVIGLRLSHK